MTEVLTIGHSTHPIETFLDLLRGANVEAIADVRSSPYSRFNPQFNREHLKAALRGAGIAYAFLGNELGARSDQPSHYVSGQVSYPRLAASELFRSGIARVLAGAAKQRIALMCAEKDPVTCHRTILVARAFAEAGVKVRHVGPDGAFEDHCDALMRLRRELGIAEHDLFATPAELDDRAYRAQEARIAYKRGDDDEVAAAA